MYVDVDLLPDTATVYVFPSRQLLTTAQQARFRTELQELLKTWCAHAKPLSAGLYVDAYRVALFIDETKVGTSGCALDEWHYKLSKLTEEASIDCPYYHQVLCPEGDNYRPYTQEEALSAWKEGDLQSETLILHPQPRTKGNFFGKGGRIALGESWLARLCLGILCLGMLSSCSTKWQAERHLTAAEYQPAIRIYKKLLKKKPQQPELHYKLAEALRKINRLYEARPHYQQAISQYPEALPYYVESLKTHEAYEEAATALRIALQTKSLKTEQQQQLQAQLRQLQALQVLQSQPSYYELHPLQALNTSSPEYAPVYKAPWLYFVSTRQRSKVYISTGEPFSALFRVKLGEALQPLPTTLEALPETINLPRANIGSPAFYPNGKTMIFARGNRAKETDRKLQQANLFYSRLRRKGWTSPKLMSASSAKAWDSSPSLSADGLRLYFSSTRKGGYGGADIYLAKRSRRGRWQNPKPLGPEVNTLGDELFPHIDALDRLYFASNGHMSLGGLDIFVVDTVKGELQAKNLGVSINSAWDDFALFSVGEYRGFFTSSRPGSAGNDDLYSYINQDPSLKTIHLQLQIAVSEKEGAQALSDVLVRLISNENELITQEQSGSEGRLSLPVQAETDYFIKAEKEGYFTQRTRFSTKGRSPRKDTLRARQLLHTFHLEVLMSPIVLQKTIVLEDIYYDLGKANIRADARPGLDKLLQLMLDNPDITIELASYTDSRADADYNLDLSQRRAEAVVEYFVLRGAEKDRLHPRGYGETRLRIPDARTEEAHQANRRTEFKVLSYDKAKFRPR